MSFAQKFVFSSLLFASLSSAQIPFVTAITPGAPTRNNYTGFVGMQFETGPSPLTISALGRIYIPGNSGVHTLELVTSVGEVVPGSTVQLTMTPGTANTFQYAALPSPVQLPAGFNYYLLCQETAGGDQWYDLWPVTTTTDASVLSASYTDIHGVDINVPNTLGESYVPLNFLYTPAYSATSVTASIYNVYAVSYLYASVTPANGATVTGVQFQVNGQNYGAPVTQPTSGLYELTANFSGWLPASYAITAIATDSSGKSGVSLPFNDASTGNGAKFLSGQSLGPLRNNYGNAYGHFVGMEFTTGSEPLNIFALGRFAAPGNSQSHLLKLVNASTGQDVAGSSVTVSMTGSKAGQYVYAYLPNPVALLANTSYDLLSQETIGGDQWYDYAPVSASSVAAINGPIYQADSGAYILVKDPGASYVPLDMVLQVIAPPYGTTIYVPPPTSATFTGVVTVFAQAYSTSLAAIAKVQFLVDGQPFGPPASAQPANVYNYYAPLDSTQLANGSHTLSAIATDTLGNSTTATPQTFSVSNASTTPSPAFVSSFSPTFLRNNFSGFIGMKFTTGLVPVTISSLGRYCVAGNSGTHTLKLVQASGTDLPGGSASVSLANCSAGNYVYGSLASAVTLPAGTAYYLVSQETSGGDQWYDYASLTTSSVASVNGPVYASGGAWVTVPSPGSSYVPLNFLSISSSGGSGVTVMETINGTTVTATASSSNGPIVGVQFKIDGFPIYSQVTTAPYTLVLPNLDYGMHYISAVAEDAKGNSATSSLLEYDVVCGYCGGEAQITLVSLVSFDSTVLRNNYTGWVGMQFTTFPGANVGFYSPSAIGISCVVGQMQPHLVKLVLASTGQDVPGSTIWFEPASSCAVPGYPPTLAPFGVALAPGTTYYLVAQETSGGDQWYDIGQAMPVSAGGYSGYSTASPFFTIDGPVYWNGFQYVLVPLPNHSYVGLFIDSGIAPI